MIVLTLFQAYYFDRSDVALPGLHKYFKKQSDDEREHAMKFMNYQNKRGGSIILTEIESPSKSDWVSAKNAMSDALDLEKTVNDVCILLNNIEIRRISIVKIAIHFQFNTAVI